MPTETKFPALVETEWLASHLGDVEIRVVDGSWYMPATKRSGEAEYLSEHIPGAVFFDIDAIADRTVALPHMLPPAELIASRMRDLGIGDQHHVVVYDGAGGCTAAMRVWWTFRAFGHNRVSVLNGGLPKWKAEGHPLESGRTVRARSHFTARPRPELVRTWQQVAANVTSGAEQVIDARSQPRFNGAEPEPRPSKHIGHIPGSLNLPFPEVVDPARHGVVRDTADLKRRFAEAGIDLERPTVTSCGSGVTACVIAFAMYLLGNETVAVYDGSWSEWGNLDGVPVEKP